MESTAKMRRSSSRICAWKVFGFLAFVVSTIAQGYVPTFDEVNRIQVLFLPKDISVGTAIYRFQASDADRDYPLTFGINSRQPQDIIRMNSVSETEADAVLLRPLQSGVIYNVTIFVQDKSGQSTEIDFRINVTDARSTADNVFIQYNTTNSIKESAAVNSTVGYVLARSNDYNYRQVDLKLKGSDKFKIFPILESDKIIRGNIILTSPLDYEKQSFYELIVVASNGYIERSVDTRNIVYLSIFIVVEDEQDAPPIFTQLPSVVRIPSDLKVGGKVLQAKAEDGDTAKKRAIKYSILEGPDAQYFKIDVGGGDIVLTQDASAITQANGGAPVILTVQAEEVDDPNPSSLSRTSHDVVLLLGTRDSQAPVFEMEQYEGEIEEHAAAFSIVTLDKKTRVSDDDQGTAGVFTLHLEDLVEGQLIDRILEVDPPVIVRDGEFFIKVKNSELLDYEQFKDVGLQFKIVAREISENPLSSSATITVHIKDINDNSPVFSKDPYEVSIPEDVKAGTVVAKIVATDADSGEAGQIIYTGLSGEIADKFKLDPNTGVITCATSAHGFDREVKQEYDIEVEASDKGNPANRNTTTLHITLLDVNDHAPQFREGVYETVLAPDIPLSGPFLRVEAIDQDEPGTNNSIVRYEILSGNRGDTFEINRSTGELRLKKTPSVTARQSQQSGALLEDNPDDEDTSYILVVRAYDLGVPHQSSTATVHVYFKNNPGFMNGTILYVYPASVNDVNHDIERIERLLTKLNGANTIIVGLTPYMESSADFIQSRTPAEKTLIRTSVRYHKQSIVNLADVAKELNVSAVETADADRLEIAGTSQGWKIALIIILVLLSIVLMILLCFCLHRHCRKLDERKIHPAEAKPDDKNRSQVIEVATLENGFRDGRYAGTSHYHDDKIATKSNGHHMKASEEDAHLINTISKRATIGNGEDRRLSAGGLQQQQLQRSRQPQVSYSRHLHGQDSQSLKEAAAGNNVHLGQHQDDLHADDVLELEEEVATISHPQRAAPTRPSQHAPPKETGAAGYRMGADRLEPSYDVDFDNEIEEIIVIEPDQGQGHFKGPALRRVRRIVKRSPARQEPVYRSQESEEWVPMPVPEWLGKLPTEYLEEYEDDGPDPYGDYGVRGRAAVRGRGVTDGNVQAKRIKVKKYRSDGGGGSLPGDRLDEGNGHEVRRREAQEIDIEDIDELEDGEGYSPPRLRFKERPKHSTVRGRAVTRASFRVVGEDDSEDELAFRPSPRRRALADVETNEHIYDDMRDRKHVKHVRATADSSRRRDSGHEEGDSDLANDTDGHHGKTAKQKNRHSKNRSTDRNDGDAVSDDERQTEAGNTNAASQTIELDSKCTQTLSASSAQRQKTDDPASNTGGTADATGEFEYVGATRDNNQQEGSNKHKGTSLVTQTSLQTPLSQSDSTPLSQGSQSKKSMTPISKPRKPGKGKRESRYMDWYHNKNTDNSGGSVVHKGSDKHKSNVESKDQVPNSVSEPRLGVAGEASDNYNTAINGDKNIADETKATTTVRRRGSDSVMVNSGQRHQLLQSRDVALVPGQAAATAAQETSIPIATVQDNQHQQRSGTALDAMEAEIRLGGNPFVAEDDEDSGIGHTDSFKSSKKQFLEKRSLFTIAYNGMQSKQDALKDREASAGAHKIT